MTIKPILNQKAAAKHEKKDLQDGTNQNLPSHRGCLNQIASQQRKSPSPQRGSGVGGGGGGGGGGGAAEQKTQLLGNRNHYHDGGGGGIVGNSRRRRSPYKRLTSKRNDHEKICKSPTVDCATKGASSAHSNTSGNLGCKSPKSSSGIASIINNNNIGPNISNNNNNNTNANNVNNNVELVDETSYSGYNSGDEHIGQKDANLSPDEWDKRDKEFVKAMSDRGFCVSGIAEDGACLFRSISLQIYGDQDMHEVIRQHTMDYISKNREYFAQFVTEDINNYVSRKRENHVHGNHIEIQAISEIYNRPVELYSYQMEPINIFNSDQIKNGCEPLRLSYQRGSHYNAILNPYKASVGVGLGLAGYRPDEPDLKQMRDAVRLSEDLEIEQTMFEDKLKTTDWEATNEAIEEQIARESYVQWCRDNMNKAPQKAAVTTSSSTVTSSAVQLDRQSNKSPSSGGESSFDSEDFPSYPSDGDCDYEASSSKNSDAANRFYYLQQKQRRRKRRRNAPADVAGPSSTTTTTTTKLLKISRRGIVIAETTSNSTNNNDNSEKSETPGTSKQTLIDDKPMSAFYHSLLESSYAEDKADTAIDQLSEEKMLQKALQLSRMDFMQQLQQQHKTDSDPASP